MAKLYGKRSEQLTYSLEIVPITPTLDGPRDSYRVTLCENEIVVFQRQYRVWQYDHSFSLGHYWMFRIAHAFQFASHLVGAKLDFCLSPPYPAPPEYNQPACIREGIDWLEFVLWGDTVKKERRFYVMVYFGMEPEELETDSPLTHYIGICFYCAPEDAENFGRELEAECLEAKRRRFELGIEAWDDVEEHNGEEGVSEGSGQ
jgi:hypothetical protein